MSHPLLLVGPLAHPPGFSLHLRQCITHGNGHPRNLSPPPPGGGDAEWTIVRVSRHTGTTLGEQSSGHLGNRVVYATAASCKQRHWLYSK